MKRNPQYPLATLAQFIGANGFNLSDKTVLNESFDKLLLDKQRQFGFRIEGMFAYVAGALGKCSLVKQEEGGICLTSDNNIGIPDFRIILLDGTSFLAQVKSCSSRKEKFSEQYIKKQAQYAALNKLPLKVAIYWRDIQVWTLNSVDNFAFKNGSYILPIDVALATSEMAMLGDRLIGTLAPIKVRLVMDPLRTTAFDENGQCEVYVGDTQIYCQSTLIEDEIEKNIAFKLVMSGKWQEHDEVILDDDKVAFMDYTYSPIDLPTDNSFSYVGSLSSIISSSYDDATLTEGTIQKIQLESDPYRFEIPIPENYKGKYLPLWQFIQQPNLDYKSPSEN